MKNSIKNPVGKQIGELGRDIKKLLHFHLDQYSLGDGQFELLYEIYKNEGASQEDLSRVRKVDKAATTKAIKRLIENDYIYREKDTTDKRAYKVYCTKKGIDFIPKLEEILRLENEVLNVGLSEDEIKIFRVVLNKISLNIDNYFKGVKSNECIEKIRN